MLTIWRKLHIEVDSMGNATGNKVTGKVSATILVSNPNCNPPAPPTPAPSPACNPTFTRYTLTKDDGTALNLEAHRFEKGRIVIGTRAFAVLDSNTDSVDITNSTLARKMQGKSFVLYDDDDMNDDGILDGDEGDDVPEPDVSLLQSNDVLCSSLITTNCNVFASSYIRPAYDITSDTHNNRFFYLNVANDQEAIIDTFGDFDQPATEASQEFWTIYLYGGYQGDLPIDFDPNDTNGDGIENGCGDGFYGISDAVGPLGTGAIIFMETLRPRELPSDYLSRPISRAWTAAHEVGHLFVIVTI